MIKEAAGATRGPRPITRAPAPVAILSPTSLRWLPLLPALVVGTSALAVVAFAGFDGLYGQDSFAYFHYATGGLRESLLHLRLPPPFFWPLGYPLLVAVLSTVAGSGPIAGQLVSVASGAAVAGFTVLLAGEFLAPPPGGEGRGEGGRAAEGLSWLSVPLVAGLVVAVTGQLLQSSIVVMADTLGLATATAGAWAFARYQRTGRARWLALCAGAFAWATTTRWIYGLVALPFAVATLVLLGRRPRATALRHGAGAAAIAAAILLPSSVPAVLGVFAGGDAPFGGDLQVYSWSPLNALRRSFVTADGQLAYSLPNGLYYAVAPASRWYVGPILAALVAPGIWAVMRRRVAPMAGLLVAWAAIVYAFHAGAPWQNPRFALAYLPPLAVLAAIGFAQLFAAQDVRIRWFATVCLASGLAVAAIGSAVLTSRFIERKQNDVATVRWVEHLAPPKAQLLTFGLTATLQEYGRVKTLDLSELSSSQMEQLLSDGRPTLVLLDVAGIERQWRGRAPWENYRSLHDRPGLVPLGDRGVYTLFLVDEGTP